MKPLPQSATGKLLPLIDKMLVEANLTERSNSVHCHAKLIEGYARKNMDAYVDDLEDPKRVIVFGRMAGIVTAESQIGILWIYALPELRNEETREMFKAMIAGYVQAHPANAIFASDWQYKGAQMGTGAFLRSLGFERQEAIYVRVFG